MKKLLVICPSFQRADLMKQMLNSVENTSTESNVVCVVDYDDKQLVDYSKLCKSYSFTNLEINYKKSSGFVHIYNDICKKYNYQFYSPANDDFLYLTPNWDKILIEEIEKKFNGHGWAYGDDLNYTPISFYNGRKMPTTWIESSSVYETLGWLVPPYFKRSFGDWAILDLASLTNRLSYIPSVVIEHRHPSIGKSPVDVTYKKGRKHILYQRDKLVFLFWKWFLLTRTVNKINKRCCKMT